MPTPCDQIDLFVDGELSPEEAAAFRDHLPTCQRCQVQMSNLLLLERLSVRYVAKEGQRQDSQKQSPLPTATNSRRPLRWHMAVLGAAACALGALIFLSYRSIRSPTPESSAYAFSVDARQRTSPRVSDPRADQFREVPAQPAGEAQKQESFSPQEKDILERRGDVRGLAAAYLLWNKPVEALAQLKKLDAQSPDIQSDRAAAFYLLGGQEAERGKPAEALGQYEKALEILDPLLEAHPKHLQARWNRALVFEALKLPLLAARDFQEVALNEQDKRWSQEAQARADMLRSADRDNDLRWQALLELGKNLVATGRPPEESPEVRSPIMRLYFYEAVRTRTSREEVLALGPLAAQLDRDAGGDVLQRYVERISRRDFSRRAPLAQDYARLRQAKKDEPQVAVILDRILRSNEDDLIVGALDHAKAEQEHLEEFEARARASQDPWFQVFAAQKRAAGFIRRGDFTQAEDTLKKAQKLCKEAEITYRCMDLELDLAHLYEQLLQPDDVRTHAEVGWDIARAHALRGKEVQFLEMLANAARLRDSTPTARAYLHEVLERVRGDAVQERWIHEHMALQEVHALNFDQARTEIDLALATKLALTQDGAAALSDIARQRVAPGDEAAMNRAFSEVDPLDKGKHALALHHLGRFYLALSRAKGQGLLRDAIREADGAAAGDMYSAHARTYSYTALIFDAAQAHDFEAASKLFGEELGLEVPERCVLAITVDSERTLILARGADQELHAFYDQGRSKPLSLDEKELVPEAARAALKACEKVEVLARPPLQGRSDLLPSTFLWSFLTRGEVPRPLVGKAVHLVVRDVEYDPKQGLQPLQWAPVFGKSEQPRELRGAAATPKQVLREMETATEIDLVTHGRMSPVSGAAYLVLAKERGTSGTDELWAHQIRKVKLKGAPLVVLAACYAGRAAPVLHESGSLPNALLEAGARAVFAATSPVLDKEASEFFNAVRARIRQGEPPASALHTERSAWLAQKRGGTWLESVLLFE